MVMRKFIRACRNCRNGNQRDKSFEVILATPSMRPISNPIPLQHFTACCDKICCFILDSGFLSICNPHQIILNFKKSLTRNQMNAIKRSRQFVIFSFFAFSVMVFAFSIPFLKPISFSWAEMNSQLQALVFLLAAAIFSHASLSISVSNALRLFGIAFLSSYLAEYVGMRWVGFFGNLYSYNSALYPILPGGVPVIVVLMWFILAYTALKFLQPITIRPGESRSLSRLLFKGGLCALYIMATDFFIDPLATYSGLWSWHEPGGYFGTPWGNFGGWFMVGLVICCLYLLVEKPLSSDWYTNSYFWDLIFVVVSIFLTILCLIACHIHLGSGWPVALSLAVIGPFWIFWMVSNRRSQFDLQPL